MSAEAKESVPESFFINNQILHGAHGVLYARSEKSLTKDLYQVSRLVYRLELPANYHDKLCDMFERKELFLLSVHHKLQRVLTVSAVISELAKDARGNVVCLVDFDLPGQ